MRNHERVPLAEAPTEALRCPKHPNNACEVLCKTCNVLICGLCAKFGRHKGNDHECVLIADAAVATHKTLREQQQRALCALWEKLNAAAAHLEKHTARAAEQTEHKIDARFEELERQLRAVRHGLKSGVRDAMARMQRLLRAVQVLRECVVKRQQDIETAQALQPTQVLELAHQVQQLLAELEAVDPEKLHFPELHFELHVQDVLEALHAAARLSGLDL